MIVQICCYHSMVAVK